MGGVMTFLVRSACHVQVAEVRRLGVCLLCLVSVNEVFRREQDAVASIDDFFFSLSVLRPNAG